MTIIKAILRLRKPPTPPPPKLNLIICATKDTYYPEKLN